MKLFGHHSDVFIAQDMKSRNGQWSPIWSVFNTVFSNNIQKAYIWMTCYLICLLCTVESER